MSISKNSQNPQSIKNKHLAWSKIKLKIDLNKTSPKFVSEGQVWWCQIGKNIGIEIDGRNKKDKTKEVFFRPVVVFKKYNKNQGLVLPLTENHKQGIFYSNFNFQNKLTTVIKLITFKPNKKLSIKES